jgi:hypothetical protein
LTKKRKLVFLYIDAPFEEMEYIVKKFKELCTSMDDYQFVISNRRIEPMSKKDLLEVLEKIK